MPYPTIASLPDAVKDALHGHAADIWRNAFNAATDAGNDEAACSAIAWSAVEKAGWKKDDKGAWSNATEDAAAALATHYTQARAFLAALYPEIMLDADPGKATIQLKELFANTGDMEVEIFAAGKWNSDDYTQGDLEDMVKNFSILAAEIKPPVKLGHNDEGLNKIVTDGQPAYGWVKALRLTGSKLMATITQVPEILKKAIKAGRYKRVSSEVYWNLKGALINPERFSKEVFKRVLGAVAFLGADVPAVSNLKDLEALYTRSTGAAAPGSFEHARHYTFKTEDGEHITEERRSTMTDEEAKALQDENTRLKGNNDELRKANLSARKKNASEQVRVYCDAQVKGGLMQPSTRDSIMLGIKDDKYMYSDEGDGNFAIPFHTFRTVYDMRKPGKTPAIAMDSQRGRTNIEPDPDEEDEGRQDYADVQGQAAGDVVDRKVKQYMSKNKVDYSAGMKAVLQDNPKLARAYIEATPMVRHESEASQAADVDGE